jgi:hypothetical protein
MKILRWIASEYWDLVESFKFWRVKRQANALHNKTGKRYHVLPTHNGRLMIVDNEYVNAYNKLVKGTHKKITIKTLIEQSYYSTPANSGSNRDRI